MSFVKVKTNVNALLRTGEHEDEEEDNIETQKQEDVQRKANYRVQAGMLHYRGDSV